MRIAKNTAILIRLTAMVSSRTNPSSVLAVSAEIVGNDQPDDSLAEVEKSDLLKSSFEENSESARSRIKDRDLFIV
jgi:hypothetical protein